MQVYLKGNPHSRSRKQAKGQTYTRRQSTQTARQEHTGRHGNPKTGNNPRTGKHETRETLRIAVVH